MSLAPTGGGYAALAGAAGAGGKKGEFELLGVPFEDPDAFWILLDDAGGAAPPHEPPWLRYGAWTPLPGSRCWRWSIKSGSTAAFGTAGGGYAGAGADWMKEEFELLGAHLVATA
jgi:hypothetical protein